MNPKSRRTPEIRERRASSTGTRGALGAGNGFRTVRRLKKNRRSWSGIGLQRRCPEGKLQGKTRLAMNMKPNGKSRTTLNDNVLLKKATAIDHTPQYRAIHALRQAVLPSVVRH